MAATALLFFSVSQEIKNTDSSLADMLVQCIGKELEQSVYENCLPLFAYGNDAGKQGSLLEDGFAGMLPLYAYANGNYREQEISQYIVRDNSVLEEPASEETIPEEMTLDELMRKENEAVATEQIPGTNLGDAMAEIPQGSENGQVIGAESEFIPHTLVAPVDLSKWQDYETLVQDCYTIDANTMAGSDQLNTELLLAKDMTISKASEGPQILIYHTHSQEQFKDSVAGDVNTSIVGVGARLGEILTNQYGYQVLHHTGQYDVDARDDAYSLSLPAIEQVLEENPSIQVIIDLHRDQMAEETRLVMDLDGRPTARFMFFNGLSRTRKTGNISYLYNENQADNLAFSFQMQLAAMEYYPGLTRKIYLKGYRYNMHLRPKTLLVELGAQNNTVEEAMNACDPLAHILDLVLSGEG